MKKTIFFRLIGPIVLLVILFRLDTQQLLQAFRDVSMVPLLAGYFLFIPSLFIRSFRWHLFLKLQKIHLSFKESLCIYAYSVFMGSITPGRVGEFVKIFHLKKKGYSALISSFSVIVDRLFDVLVLLFIGVLGMISLFGVRLLGQFGGTKSFLIILLLAVVVMAVIYPRFFVSLLEFFLKLMARIFKVDTVSGYKKFVSEFKSLSLYHMGSMMALTFVAWICNLSAVFLFSQALGLNIHYWNVIGIAAVCSIVALIPVSILGTGTRDVSLIVILGQYSVPESTAITLSLFILSMLIFNALICSFSLLSPSCSFERA